MQKIFSATEESCRADMEIGVKYCGGCNPNYDRKKALDKFISRLSAGNSVEPVKTEKTYDKILLICGCERSCIRDFRKVQANEYFVLTNADDFDRIGTVFS